jgi:hypothetical protein
MKKLFTNEIGEVKMKKNGKKKHFVVQKNVFSFLAIHGTLHFQDNL